MPGKGVRALIGLSLALLLMLAARPAMAQSKSDWFGDSWQVGGFVYVSPTFEGSRSYEAIAFPFIAPSGVGPDGFIQVKGIDDVRMRLFNFSGFEFGPLAGYRFGRDGDDVHNAVVDDVDGGLVVGAFATYRAGQFAFSVSYHQQVTGDDTGALIRLGVEHVAQLAPRLKLTTGIGTNYATDDYMTAFFGTGLYSPDAGFKDIYIGATAALDLSDNWTLLLVGRYSHLIGDAADSPVVETDSQFYGGVGLSYKFGR